MAFIMIHTGVRSAQQMFSSSEGMAWHCPHKHLFIDNDFYEYSIYCYQDSHIWPHGQAVYFALTTPWPLGSTVCFLVAVVVVGPEKSLSQTAQIGTVVPAPALPLCLVPCFFRAVGENGEETTTFTLILWTHMSLWFQALLGSNAL